MSFSCTRSLKSERVSYTHSTSQFRPARTAQQPREARGLGPKAPGSVSAGLLGNFELFLLTTLLTPNVCVAG